jgi:hypothetical protein
MKKTLLWGLLVVSASLSHAEKKDDHKGHSHGAETIKHDLGTTTVSGVRFSVSQETLIKAGKEAGFDLTVLETAKPPIAIRVWYGTESAEGSVRTRAKAGKNGHYHCHVDVPKSPPQESRFWAEIELDSGKVKTSFDVKKK